MLLIHVLSNVAGQPSLDSPLVHQLVVGVWSLALVAILLGWQTKFATLVGAVAALTLAGATGGMAAIGDLPVQLSIYLALAPVGATWSLDALSRASAGYKDPVEGFELAVSRPRPSPVYVEPWSYRLLQLYLVGTYCILALSVTDGASDSWFSGEALFGVLQQPSVARFSPDELSISVGLCQVISIVALVWAVSMPALAFQRRSVPLMLGLGLLFHVLLTALFKTGSSGYLLLAFYPLFIEGSAWSKRAVSMSRTNSSAPFVVAYDTFCPLCRRSRLLLEHMDLGERLRFVDIHDRDVMAREFQEVSYAQCLEELQVKTPDGEVTGGFFAFRTLTRVLPALRSVRWFFFLPGVPLAGQRVYRWIAKHRYRLVDCESEVCNLHVRALSQANIDEAEIAAIIRRAREAAQGHSR